MNIIPEEFLPIRARNKFIDGSKPLRIGVVSAPIKDVGIAQTRVVDLNSGLDIDNVCEVQLIFKAAEPPQIRMTLEYCEDNSYYIGGGRYLMFESHPIKEWLGKFKRKFITGEVLFYQKKTFTLKDLNLNIENGLF